MIIDVQPTEDDIIKAEIENLTKMIHEVMGGIKQAQANLTKMAVVRNYLLKSVGDSDQQLTFDFDAIDAEQTAN
jgi:flagellar hook-basal body complex protein FliE